MKINIVIFIFLSIFFSNPSQAMFSEMEEDGVGSKIARAAFYSGMAKGGEWLVSGLILNDLDRFGDSKEKTIFGVALRGQFFIDNKEIVGQCGRYIGATGGVFLGIASVDYVVPGGKHIASCWKRCCESIWEWDSTKSSKRDKIVTVLSAGLGVASFYYGENILSTLFGKDWRKLIWK